MPADDVVIIGAGPFGLSIAAHLRDLGVGHRIVGRPMDTWLAHCPDGMKLRSEPYGSDMASPRPGYDVEAFSAQHGRDYVARLGPLSVEHFRDYSAWYTRELVPDVEDRTVTDVVRSGSDFQVFFADGGDLTARQVIVATGVLPYQVIPQELSGLPRDLVSHSCDHGHADLKAYAGRRVAVIGGGQSATETLALLHEAGADARIVMRRSGINWLEPNPEELGPFGQLRRPVNKLCEGWHCSFWNTPAAFRLLPKKVRVDKARSVLGPAAAWWLRDRVDGRIEVIGNTQVKAAEAHGSGVRLTLAGPTTSTLDVDHVVSATGFRVDIARLPFLSLDLVGRVKTLNRYPVLDRAGQSSVPGLYFAGAPAAVSLGPSVRFIAGTHTSVRQLSRSVAGQAVAAKPRAVAVA
jgi:thioredoxin reductase